MRSGPAANGYAGRRRPTTAGVLAPESTVEWHVTRTRHNIRTALVTGATEGIGHEVAYRLAATGARVVVHARAADEGAEVVERLVNDGADPRRLDLVVADFARLADVTALGRDVAPSTRGWIYLVNNAAAPAARSPRTATS